MAESEAVLIAYERALEAWLNTNPARIPSRDVRLDAMRSALREARAWLPIDENTPRDGTLLLLWDAKQQVAVSGCWHVEPAIDSPNERSPGWAWWTSDNEVIMWDGGPDDAPTHWQFFHPPQGL